MGVHPESTREAVPVSERPRPTVEDAQRRRCVCEHTARVHIFIGLNPGPCAWHGCGCKKFEEAEKETA